MKITNFISALALLGFAFMASAQDTEPLKYQNN